MDEEKKVTRAYEMSPEVASMFFVLVKWSTDHGVTDSVTLREYILKWLAENKFMDRVYETGRTEDQIISDLQDKGIKILDGRKYDSKPKDNDGSFIGRLQRTLERMVKVHILGDTE